MPDKWQKTINNPINLDEIYSRPDAQNNPHPRPGVVDRLELEQAFLKLDYQTQEKLFKDFFQREPRGCFLIHGRSNCGQGLLLTRLIQQIYRSTNSKKIPIDLATNSIGFDRLLRQIGKPLGVKSGSAEEVAGGIYRQWQKSNVIIILKSVNMHPPESLQTIIDFWCILDGFFRDKETRDYSLLMFLIDYSGSLQLPNINCVDKLERNWQPKTLVRLPKLPESFDECILSHWLSEHFKIFPRTVSTKLRDRMSSILQSQDGFPEDVLETICDDFCHCEWHNLKTRLHS